MIENAQELKELLNDGVPDVWEAVYDCATYDPEATNAADAFGSLDIIVCTDATLQWDWRNRKWVAS